jgi:TP901 family phage tail tape measure protein
MASPTNLVLQLLITAKDQASSILSNLKTQLAALGAGIAAAFSLKEAANFEKALDAVRARADETGPALEALIDRVKEAAQTLGPEFGFSAAEAVGGIKELIAAGFSADDSIKALKGTLALAAMEGINVQQAALLLSDAIAQFGLTAGDASKVADILAASAGAVAATAVEMAEALKYTGNAASQAGLSLTETSAVLDVLAKAGQRGSEAGTGLSSVLNILANPASAATKALFDMGATSTELADVLDFLGSRGLNAAETIALFGEQGGRVINTLLAQGGTAAIQQFAEEIGNTGKSAEATAKVMQQNLLGAFDRFWESLKRVGTELATPKLEPYARGLDTLTESLNTFASNDKIRAFQAAVFEGFSAIYTAARDFANQIDWAGVSAVISGAFEKIGGAVQTTLTALQSIYASLTGSLPGAASIAQQASDGLKTVWESLGNVAQAAAGGIERIAQALSGPVTVGSDLARQALQALTGETDAARQAYDILNSALKAGTISQEQVAAAWERLQTAIANAQGEINAAQIAYDAVVAAQQAGTATQEQVNAAWERLQAVMGAAQGKIDSARLAFDGLNLQFNTGKGLTEAVALAHERLNSTIESVRQSVEKITSAVSGQTQGFQALWGALQSEAPTFLKATFDSLATAAGDLLAGINALAQEGAKFIAGFIKNADLSPVRDLFNAVADSALRLVGVIVDAFPKAEKAGANFADSFTIAWSGVVGILSAVVSGTLKVVEAIGQATFEVGKYFDRYSEAEIKKIEANLNGLSDSAGEFAAVAARSFEASGQALDRMRERSQQAADGQKALEDAGKGAAKAQDEAATAAERQAGSQEALAGKAESLAFALQKQAAEVDALAKADLSSEEAKNRHAAATQKLWDLQEGFGQAVKGLTAEQFANVAANEQVQQSLAQLGTVVEAGAVVLGQYVGQVREAPQSLDQLRATMEKTRAEMQRVEEAYKNGTLKATENKSVTEQLNEARKRAADGLAVYKSALERNIATEEASVKTAEQKRQAITALAQSQEALIDASIRLAEIEGNEAKVATLVAEKKSEQLKSSQAVAAQYEKEATATQAVADALRLKYDNLVKTNPLDTEGIRQAKEAADAAQAEAYAKKAVAIETAAIIPVLEEEAEIAARAAGPIGELIRLYQDQADALDRTRSAIESTYDARQAEQQSIERIAIAQGDERAAREAVIEQKNLAADQARELAVLAQEEADLAQQNISIKTLELAADGELSAADQQQIADLQLLALEKQNAAESSRLNADALDAEAGAVRRTSSVFDEWKDNLKIFGDTAADAAERLERMNAAAEKSAQERVVELKKQGSLVSDIINGWNNRLGALSAAAEEAFRNTSQGGDYAAKAVAQVTDATELLRIAQKNIAAGGFITWANRLAQQALEIELAFKGQAETTDRLAESLENVAERGGVSAGAIATLTRQAEAAKTSFTLLDQARLDRLQDAIEGANDKLREMQEETQSARDRLTELNAELLEARGLDQKAQLLRQQLDYQQTLAEIEARQQEAELTGNRELITILNEQRSTLEQINRVKIANIQADTDNSAATDRTTSSISRLADEAERASRAMNQVSAADLSKLSIQSETLRRNFADLNTLL